MRSFELVSDYKLTGDQPGAVEALQQGLRDGLQEQVLLGVTGSGKTFTIANLIAREQRPSSYPARFPVPDHAVEWRVELAGYDPPYFVDPVVLAACRPGGWADPEAIGEVDRELARAGAGSAGAHRCRLGAECVLAVRSRNSSG